MNDKIKQLAEQADWRFSDKITGDELQPILDKRLEKFAELIVRECSTAFEAEVDTWKEMDPYQGSIKRQGTKAIKQHFGVKE